MNTGVDSKDLGVAIDVSISYVVHDDVLEDIVPVGVVALDDEIEEKDLVLLVGDLFQFGNNILHLWRELLKGYSCKKSP